MQQHLFQPSRETRRRPTREQGLALEKLGHAIEYLMYMNASSGFERGAPRFEAYRILSDASKLVFEQCAPVVSLPERLRNYFAHMLHLDAHEVLRTPLK